MERSLSSIMSKSIGTTLHDKNNDAFSKYLGTFKQCFFFIYITIVDAPMDHIQTGEDNILVSEAEDQKTINHFQLTDPHILGHMKEKEETFTSKKAATHIHKIEDAELPTNFESPYTPLPAIVEFKRIIGNVMNALKFEREFETEKKNEMVLFYSNFNI